MVRIKQMAIVCRDPQEMREYYGRWFGLEDLHRTKHGNVYLSDGYLNIALLKQGADPTEKNQELGLHHFGIEIDSIAEIEKRLKEFDPSIHLERRSGGEDPFSEWRVVDEKDPWALPADLSEKGFGVAGNKRVPGIRHIAGGTMDVERRLRLFTQVFGMQEVETHTGRRQDGVRSRGCAADGFVNHCLVNRNDEGARHFGVLINSPAGVVSHMSEAYPSRPELWQLVRPGVESHIRDIEGNNLSLSAKRGWEVAPGVWDKLQG
jgi:catechol 2,3-dioxygenase-like lactoylglutathione lyase family enzyme